jgi:hypothetical protein
VKRSIRGAILAAALVPLGSAGSLVPPAYASKNMTIVVGQSIGGVTVGESEAQVRKALGRPLAERAGRWQYGQGPIGLIAAFKHKTVYDVWTPRSEYKTNKGISVASSPAQVSKAYPNAKCKLGAGPGAGPGEESEACILKSKYHGHTVETAFEWRNKEKAMEEIGIYLS